MAMSIIAADTSTKVAGKRSLALVSEKAISKKTTGSIDLTFLKTHINVKNVILG